MRSGSLVRLKRKYPASNRDIIVISPSFSSSDEREGETQNLMYTALSINEALTANAQDFKLHRHIITVGDALDSMRDDQIENEVNEMLEERAGLEELAHDDFLDK